MPATDGSTEPHLNLTVWHSTTPSAKSCLALDTSECKAPATLPGQNGPVTKPSPGRLPASRRMILMRNAGNWLNLSTPLGLAVARAGGARIRRGPRGLWLADGYRWKYPDGSAFTIGSVIATHHPDIDALFHRRAGLLAHEESHAWQWTMCAGLPFLPLYGAMAAWSALRHGDLATGNFFERQADLVDGGYLPRE